MSQNYVYPGSSDAYVPSLSSDLVVEYSRNPDRFPLVEYCDYKIVDKPRGYYVKMLNDGQVRIIDDTDNLWADGGDSPQWTDGNDSFTFATYDCVRRRQPKRIGHIAIDTAGWDIVAQAVRFEAMQMMTKRVRRIHETLTTSANWTYGLNNTLSNYATSTTLGGGPWSAATATNPYIRKSLAQAEINIEQATYGVVQPKDLFVVSNPVAATQVATSNEFLDFVKQNPLAISIWENDSQFRTYGLPRNVMGLNWIVDNTVYNSAPPGANPVLSFTFPNNYAVLMSKQKAISSSSGSAFSTFTAFVYEDFITEQFDDPKQRRVEMYVTENIDTSVNSLVAPQSGYLIAINS